MTFSFAEQYGKRHGLIERSGMQAQHLGALQYLADSKAWASWFNRDRDADYADLFDHARIFWLSPNAKHKAWRVGFSPYPHVQSRLHVFEEAAEALNLDVIVGDEDHRTYEVPATIPVMFFRK